MSTTTVIKSCLDILRRTDPKDTEKHLASLSSLVSNDDSIEELYQRVDVPLKVCKDNASDGRLFLICDHNRDGDSHRSPWSNTYIPPLGDGDDGFRPSDRLRKLELHANEVFDVYRQLYYGKMTSVSSVYLWDKEDDGAKKGGIDAEAGFAGCFLIQNKVEGDDTLGYWNSFHVVDVGKIKGGKCQYKLTTTILLSITPSEPQSTTISGSLIRQNVRECKISSSGDESSSSSHIINIGKFIEDVETGMRSEVDSLYIQKTRHVVDRIRKENPKSVTQGQEHTKVLNEAVLAMAMSRQAKLSEKK